MDCAFYVLDACGDKFCYTVAAADYEAGFRKHAAWWMRHATRPGAHNDTDSRGVRVRNPVKPLRVVVEPLTRG
jgi:hypothetical protein